MGQVLTMAEEQHAFFSEIGIAITHWAKVESALRYLTLACFSNRNNMNHRVLSLGFFSIDTFRLKLQYTDAMLRRKFSDNPSISDWPPLAEKVNTLSGSRNKVAHRSFKLYTHNKPGRRIVLVPWIFTKPKFKTRRSMPPQGSLGILDLIKIDFEFISAEAALENFRCRVLGRREPFPKACEQALDPPKIESLSRLLRASLEPRP